MAEKMELVLKIAELAEYLWIPKSALYKLAQEDEIPGQEVGRHWLFHRDAIDGWLKNQGSTTERTGESS